MPCLPHDDAPDARRGWSLHPHGACASPLRPGVATETHDRAAFKELRKQLHRIDTFFVKQKTIHNKSYLSFSFFCIIVSYAIFAAQLLLLTP